MSKEENKSFVAVFMGFVLATIIAGICEYNALTISLGFLSSIIFVSKVYEDKK